MVDGVLTGNDPNSTYTLDIDSTALANGNHTLSAVAYDAAGNAGVSPTVSFTVSNVSVDTTAPSVSAAVTGNSGSISFTATASDHVGVTLVDFIEIGRASCRDRVCTNVWNMMVYVALKKKIK